MKMKILVFLLINLCMLVKCVYKQERAMITYANPKYMSNVTCITIRSRRGEHYRTNITATTIYGWGNNVTMKITYKALGSAIDFKFESKLCEAFKHSWFNKFLKQFTSIRTCPVLPGKYAFTNIDFDTTVLPLPMPKGMNVMTTLFYDTKTQENIIEANVVIKV